MQRILIHMGDPYLIDNPCTKRVRAFKEELEKQGFETVIMAPDIKGIAKDSEVTYCPAIPLKKKNIFYRLANGVSFAVSSVCKSGKIGKIDIVITTVPPALISIAGWILARLKQARLVYDVRDIWPDVALEMNEFTKNSIYYGIFRFIRDFMLKHADLVTAVSEGKTKKLKGYVPDKEVITVPNGFDLHFLENKLNPVLYEKMAGQDKCVCVYTGNIGLAQGLRQLLYIAGKAKENKLNVNFWIYGKGAKEQELKEYVRNKQLDNVFFGGKLSNKDIYTVLKAADISFVPLVNEKLKDSIPTKIYEALGVGCPVLLAAKGDAVTVLKEAGLGMAVPPNQLEELWEAFDKMYRNRSRTGHLRDNAVKLMRDKYSIQHSARILADVLKRMWAEERNGVNRKDD